MFLAWLNKAPEAVVSQLTPEWKLKQVSSGWPFLGGNRPMVCSGGGGAWQRNERSWNNLQSCWSQSRHSLFSVFKDRTGQFMKKWNLRGVDRLGSRCLRVCASSCPIVLRHCQTCVRLRPAKNTPRLSSLAFTCRSLQSITVLFLCAQYFEGTLLYDIPLMTGRATLIWDMKVPSPVGQLLAWTEQKKTSLEGGKGMMCGVHLVVSCHRQHGNQVFEPANMWTDLPCRNENCFSSIAEISTDPSNYVT